MSMSILLISHDLNMVQKMADRILVMHKGNFIECEEAKNLLSHPQMPYTQKLIASEPAGTPKPLTKEAKLVLETHNLSTTFTKRRLFQKFKPLFAVKNISLTLRAGETLGIVGESGSGKSTLLYTILKLLPQASGSVVFLSKEISRYRQKEFKSLRKDIQIVFQDPFGALNPRFTVFDILSEGLKLHESTLTEAEIDERVCQVMRDISMDIKLRYRYPHEFSGGQRQRIAIGRALILKPKVLALDEPTSALDRTIQKEIIELLRSVQERFNISYLFVSHDLKVVRAMSHRIIVMRHGEIIEQGADLLTHPKTPYTRDLIRASGISS
jgi:microcin C transport system ATP-binding protein